MTTDVTPPRAASPDAARTAPGAPGPRLPRRHRPAEGSPWRPISRAELEQRFYTQADGADSAVEGVPATGATAPAEPSQRGPEVDLVFCMDCTGSMGSHIKSAKHSIETIARKLIEVEGYDLRFGVVAYRDYNDNDSGRSYPVLTFPFTSQIEVMEEYLTSLSASDDPYGDGPEAVEEGLTRVAEMEWRDTPTKLCVLIGDAPPHGLGEWHDDYPEGPPSGIDALQVLDGLADKGVVVYALGCEPTLSASYAYGADFWIAAAEKTFGRAIALKSPSALSDVVIGAVVEEMDLESLGRGIHAWTDEVRRQHPNLDSEDVQDAVYRSLRATEPRPFRRLQIPELTSATAGLVVKASTLSEARLQLRAAKEPEAVCVDATASTAAAMPAIPALVPITLYTGELSRAQFDRMYKRLAKQRGE